MPIRRLVTAVFVALLVVPASALAGPPGKWTQLGQANLRNIDEVALARTPDGTLHAVWTIAAANNDTLVHDSIAANGTAAPAPNAIQSGWAAITAVPDLVTTSTGLRVFFGGIRTTNSEERNQNMNTATAPPDGSAWDLFPGTIVTGDSAYAGDDGAALLPDGTPLFAMGGTGAGVFVHRGLDPTTPNFQLQTQLGGCCGYSPDVGVDTKSGAPFAVWISNATGKGGVFAQSLDPATGAPSGAPAQMPGSTTLFNGNQETSQQLSRVPVAARAGGGVYVAYPGGYPVTKKVLLWHVANSTSSVLGTSDHDHLVSLAADPEGRLWVFWIERGSKPLVFARRSNASATKFGPAVKLGPAPGQTQAYKISGNAQSGVLDLVVLFGTTSTQAQWHTQVQPGLGVTATPSKINGKSGSKVTFKVTDPDSVAGAKVSGGGESGTTAGSGTTTLNIGATKKKSITFTVTKAGYSKGTIKLKVKH